MLENTINKQKLKKIYKIQKEVLSYEEKFLNMEDKFLGFQTQIFKNRIKNGETLDDILPEAFAVCREVTFRVLKMKHYPVQILGGIAIHQGKIAEMKTGEGKTLVELLPAYLNALSGNNVHIITVNDYLAKRDYQQMSAIFNALNLTVGYIYPQMPFYERKKAYECDVVYGTNNEFGFDYLRDNLAKVKQNKVQRGHHFAIIDEIDSILIDEARTPLIISQKEEEDTSIYSKVDYFCKRLKYQKETFVDMEKDIDENYDCDCLVDEKNKTVSLTDKGIKKAEKYFNLKNYSDENNVTLRHFITQSLKAISLMKKDKDYIVKDEGETQKVLIVDEFTGRVLDGRRFNDGLHQAIEAKENIAILNESKTCASVTFQNYFKLYTKLSGMTGTAITEAVEFDEVYDLDVVSIPTNKPIMRKDLDDSIYVSKKAKFNAIIKEIKNANKYGQPVLVGTQTVDASEELSKLLSKEKIPHKVLNAKNNEKEAEIIAQAGRCFAVTISTNMAGRGTDILLGGNPELLFKNKLDKSPTSKALEDPNYVKNLYSDVIKECKENAKRVKQLGGLYVIGTVRHDSRRIDNQLRGRAGRQGDPGKSKFFISLDDDLMRIYNGSKSQKIIAENLNENECLTSKRISKTIENAQKSLEQVNYSQRKRVLNFDDVLNKQRISIYETRNSILSGSENEKIHSTIRNNVFKTIESAVKYYLPDKFTLPRLQGLFQYFGGMFNKCADEVAQIVNDDASSPFEQQIDTIIEIFKTEARHIIEEREDKFGINAEIELEKQILLLCIDKNWIEQVDAMEELKKGIQLCSYAQKNPIFEYSNEGYDMFLEMNKTIVQESSLMILGATMEKLDKD